MSFVIKKKRFFELLQLAKTEEQKATVAARIMYGHGNQALHDALEELEDLEDEDTESCIDDGLEYLETLTVVTIDKDDLN